MSTLPRNEKQTQAVLFDPMKEKEAKRKRQMAELLVAQGNAPVRNEQAGGMTVLRSPWENINQAAQKYMGEFQLSKADEMDANVDNQRGILMGEVLKNLESNPQEAYKILSQDPSQRENALKMYADMLSDNRKMEQMRELAQIRGAGGGNTPAAMQIANKMFELEQSMNNPNLSIEERTLANREYNLLGQAAKTYGFDRGITAGFNQGIVPSGQPVPLGLPDGIQGSGDTAVPPAQGLDIPQRPVYNVAPSVAPIQGYGEAVGSIAAQKKAAETTAASDAKYMAEGRQTLPKMERALQDAERNNQNLSRVVNQVANDAQGAFRTGFTGTIAGAVPGSPAYDLRQNINTLRANAAFNTLQNMRNNSPTGGALGAISERELDLLESAFTNLSNSQTYEQFMQNLDAFNKQNQASLQAMRDAYSQDYQRFGGQGDRFLPPPREQQQSQQPQIAVNPQTGERLINRGNGWEPYQ